MNFLPKTLSIRQSPGFSPVSSFSSLARLLLVVLWLTVLALPTSGTPEKPEKTASRMVVLGDPHLPGNHPEAKKAVIQDINSWQGIDMVVAVGDITKTTGTINEYAYAAKFFAELKHPLFLVNGNHDYVFSDTEYANSGMFKITGAAERSSKLDRFMNTFNMRELSYSKDLGQYHLIFVSLDSLDGKTYAQFSEDRMKWLEWELFSHQNQPTIIFTHAPLWPPAVTSTNPKLAYFISQPQERLLALVQKNPQIVLWVAGHVHLGALNPNSVSPANRLGKTTVINTCDLDGHSILTGTDMATQLHNTIWTTSLFLNPEKITVKVYDHTNQKWLEELSRDFPVSTGR